MAWSDEEAQRLIARIAEYEVEIAKPKKQLLDMMNTCTPEEKKKIGIGPNQVVVDVRVVDGEVKLRVEGIENE
jgi:hypothetical protein